MSRNKADRSAPTTGGGARLKQRRKSRLAEWVHLVDVNYLRHVTSALRLVAAESSIGAYPQSQGEFIRAHLLAPLDALIDEAYEAGARGSAELTAARAMYECAERFAEHFEDRYPFDAERAAAWSERLHVAWLDLVAALAGPFAFNALQAQVQRQRAPLEGRSRREAEGKAPPSALLLAKIDPATGELPKAALLDLKEQFGVSESTLYRALRRARGTLAASKTTK